MSRRANAAAASVLDSGSAVRRASPPDPLQTFFALVFQQEQERRETPQAESKQRTEDLASILETLRSVATSEFELREVLAFLTERALVITGAEGAAIALSAEGEIRCVARAGVLAPALGVVVQADRGLSGECIRTGSTVWCDDTRADERIEASAILESGIRSVLAAPVHGRQGIIGLLEVFSSRCAAFGDRERDMAEVLAAVVAQSARMYPPGDASAADFSGPAEDEDKEGTRAEATISAEATPAAESGQATAATAFDAPSEVSDQGAAVPDLGAEVSDRDADREPAEPNLVITVYKPPAFSSPVSQWLLGLIVSIVLAALIIGGYRFFERYRSGKAVPAATSPEASPNPASPAPESPQEPNPTVEAPPAASGPESPAMPAVATVLGVRHSAKADFTTIVVDLDRPVTVRPASLRNPERLYFDLLETRLGEELAPGVSAAAKIKNFEISDRYVSRVRLSQNESTTRVVLDLNCACEYSFVMAQSPPYRLVINIDAARRRKADETAAPASGQARTAGGDLLPGISSHALKIVIDPGHGGHDLGAVGRGGLQEKDLVLDIGKRLGALLADRLGAEIVFTRTADEFVPLETRSQMANQAAADLIISIHGNYSRSPLARGVETYYFDGGAAGAQLQTVDARIAESRKLATAIQRSLSAQYDPQFNRGVKRADFTLLSETAIPAVLTEIAFLSSAADERSLKHAATREKMAEAIYDGIAAYCKTRTQRLQARNLH